MKRKGDPFDALRRTNPLRDDEVSGPGSPEAEELLARILKTPLDEQEQAVPRRRTLRLVIAVAAISVVTVAATWIWVRSISIPNAVICYQAVDLAADAAAAPPGDRASAEACVPVWEEQTLLNPDIAPPGSVPHLTACVAENGALAVLPTDDPTICDQLGLARPDPTTQEQADRIRQLEEELIEYFQSTECRPVPEATERVADLVAEYGLANWGIESADGNPDRPCASFSIDPELETIFIVPIPRP